MKRQRTLPLFTKFVRMSGSMTAANWPHVGHSKSAYSMISIGALALPLT